MTQKQEAAVIERLREEAERKYPRRLGVLARRLGWSRPKLSKILSHDQEAKLVEVIKLCALLGITLPELMRAAAG